MDPESETVGIRNEGRRGGEGLPRMLITPPLSQPGRSLAPGAHLTGLRIQYRDLLHLHLGAHYTCEKEVKIAGC